MAGDLQAVVVRWAAGIDPSDALSSVASRDASGLCGAEAARLADPQQPPPGWHHHPLIGAKEIYAPSERGITADWRRTVGIICKPADVPLTPTLRLRWSWRLDELPSRLPEDTALTHDYLSVALEFDDGQDLTWHWSSSLPPGFAYRCPLEHWRHRETHIVARSGTADLGRWIEEERPVLADHQVAIGGPAPARVVRAWLIAATALYLAVSVSPALAATTTLDELLKPSPISAAGDTVVWSRYDETAMSYQPVVSVAGRQAS